VPWPSQVTKIEPHFNRLTLFDPRSPHGVQLVEGTMDPLQSRVVLHGWFTSPTPFFEGSGLPFVMDTSAICSLPAAVLPTCGAFAHGQGPLLHCWGCLVLRLSGAATGRRAMQCAQLLCVLCRAIYSVLVHYGWQTWELVKF